MSHPRSQAASSGRIFAGGVLMGMANLVPGVSGGTMILAVGLYDAFIAAVADVTRLRLRPATLLFLGLLAAGLGVAVVTLAGPAVWLVTTHRWIAYSLFIGMTLGGVPLLLRVVRPIRGAEVLAILGGIGVMVALAFGLRDTALPQTAPVLCVVGAVAASSMILPGISGSYILLIFGMYDVVVGSLRPRVLLEEFGEAFGIVLPVVIGVVLGIGLLSNVLKILLARFERPAHAALLGLLLGSVVGLWPFQEALHAELASRDGVNAIEALVGGADRETILADTGVELDAARIPELRERFAGKSRGDLKRMGLELRRYEPSASRIAIALGLVVLGFVLTTLLAPRPKEYEASVHHPEVV